MMFNEFLRIAKMLNAQFNVSPLLYGSLGLGRLLNKDFNPQDIDFLIPGDVLENQWEQLKAAVEEMGYDLKDLHEHEFFGNGIRIAFAPFARLELDLGINLDNLVDESEAGILFKSLTLEQFLAAYEFSSKDGYRRDKNQNKDSHKIESIKAALAVK